MDSIEEFEQKVSVWIAEWWGVPAVHLSPDTVINIGLGITGDDAVELLQCLQGKTGVNFSQFEYDRFFGPEGVPWPRMFNWMRGKQKFGLDVLTIRMLAKFIHDQLASPR